MKKLLFTVAVATAAFGSANVASATVVDPLGDAIAVMGAPGPILDINTIDVQYSAFDLIFEMTFHTPISAPSLGLPDGLGGVLEFDVDQSSATGENPIQNLFSPPFANLDAGVDHWLDFFSEVNHPGFVNLHSTGVGLFTLIPVEFGPMSVSGSIPLALLDADDGLVNFTALIGTFAQPTDATDVIGESTALPAPGALALLGLAGLTARRRRRTC